MHRFKRRSYIREIYSDRNGSLDPPSDHMVGDLVPVHSYVILEP
jgi:hypothetical protein